MDAWDVDFEEEPAHLSGFAGQGSHSTIDVTYARDSRLALWLPATMNEEYTGTLHVVSLGRSNRTSSTTTDQAMITATASYSDFKRFETGAIVK